MRRRHCLAWTLTGLGLSAGIVVANPGEDSFSAKLGISSTLVVVGEPLVLDLTVTNASEEPLTLAYPPAWEGRFGRLEFLQAPNAEAIEAGGEVDTTAGVWAAVASAKREYAGGEEIRLAPKTLTCALPGIYEVQYRYRVRSEDIGSSRDAQTREDLSNKDVWTGEFSSNAVRWEVTEPEGADAAAMQAFLVECPGANPKNILFAWDKQILTRFPDSTYAGYAMARLVSFLPGVGSSPADRVAQLANPDFFARFPKTYLRESPPPEGEWLSMERAVRERERLLRTFIDDHPSFPLREKLEQQLGELELVLGNYRRAFEAWSWLAENATCQREWYTRMSEAMESQGLMAPPEQTVKP